MELRQVRKMGQDQGFSFPFFKENIVLTVFLCFVEGVWRPGTGAVGGRDLCVARVPQNTTNINAAADRTVKFDPSQVLVYTASSQRLSHRCAATMGSFRFRYDEMGVLFTVVTSENTLESGLLQVRSRDTAVKETMHISEMKKFLLRYVSAADNSWVDSVVCATSSLFLWGVFSCQTDLQNTCSVFIWINNFVSLGAVLWFIWMKLIFLFLHGTFGW